MSLYTETIGYIIHQRNYKDSSLIIEFFSQDLGKIQLIAKGIKKNKHLKSQLQYFNRVKIQFFGKSGLKTLSSINSLSQITLDGVIENSAGLYLNELIHFSLEEKSQSLFNCYEFILNHLGKEKLAPLLRKFEKEILKYSGFELSTESFDDNNEWLCVDNIKGLIVTAIDSRKICTVEDLSLFIKNKKLNSISQRRINILMKKMIDLSINFRKIYSRELLITLTMTTRPVISAEPRREQ